MTTDRKPETLGLGARADLLYVADHWRSLTALLTPSTSTPDGMPRAESQDPHLPIDVEVSDLMETITNDVRFYARILLDEVPAQHGCLGVCHGSLDHVCEVGCQGAGPFNCPDPQTAVTSSRMPTMLRDVAARFGHFTADPREKVEFCDMAHEMRNTVEKALTSRIPAKYVGPCQTTECAGELYVTEEALFAECRICGGSFSRPARRDWLNTQMGERLMTASEIGVALKMLGSTTQASTVRWWIFRAKQGKRGLVEVEDGLYRLADAVALCHGLTEKAAA
jgi:hypothetical protein